MAWGLLWAEVAEDHRGVDGGRLAHHVEDLDVRLSLPVSELGRSAVIVISEAQEFARAGEQGMGENEQADT